MRIRCSGASVLLSYKDSARNVPTDIDCIDCIVRGRKANICDGECGDYTRSGCSCGKAMFLDREIVIEVIPKPHPW